MIIDNDDLPVGRILSRREVLTLFGATSTAALLSGCIPGVNGPPPGGAASSNSITAAAAATTNATLPPSCVVRPELTEGPYFVDEKLNRSDIRSDPSDSAVSEGAALELTFNVTQVSSNACTPLAGVQVDVWHCDAHGVYSDATDRGFNTTGKKFLRGYQVTDAAGVAKFTTIYPGWYDGRAVHIHFKLRNEQGYEFTSQLFFDDAFTDEVYAAEPYASKGIRTLRNDGDNIFQQSAGQTLITVNKVDAGYAAAFNIGLQL